MAKDINKCMFTGRLGRDPEVRSMPSGDPVAKFSIAVSDAYKDKNSGQMVDKTTWVNIVATGKVAEICERYLKKGSWIHAETKMEVRKWDDEKGNKRETVEFRLENLLMLDRRDPNENAGTSTSRPAAHPGGSRPRNQAPANNPSNPPSAWPDDDVPVY